MRTLGLKYIPNTRRSMTQPIPAADIPFFEPSLLEPEAAWKEACRVAISQIRSPHSTPKADPARAAHARDSRKFNLGVSDFLYNQTPSPSIASTIRGTLGLAAIFQRYHGNFNGSQRVALRLAELFGFSPSELSTHGIHWIARSIEAYPELGRTLFRGPTHAALANIDNATPTTSLAVALRIHTALSGFTEADQPFKSAAIASALHHKKLESWLCELAANGLHEFIPEPDELPDARCFSGEFSDKIFSKLLSARFREPHSKNPPTAAQKADSWQSAILCWEKLQKLPLGPSRPDRLGCGPRARDAGIGLLISEALSTQPRGEAIAERLGFAGLKESSTAEALFGERAAGLRPAIEALGGSPSDSTGFDLPAGILNRWLTSAADSPRWPQAIAELAKAGARLRPFQDGEAGDRTMSLAARLAHAIPGMPSPELAGQIGSIGIDPLETPQAGRCLLSMNMKSASRDECLAGAARAFAFAAGAGVSPEQMAASRDADGSTPMHWAVRALSPAAIALFRDLGADPDAQDHLGRSAAHWLSNKTSKTWDADLAETARALAAAGADFSLPDNGGASPAMLMAKVSPQLALETCFQINPEALSLKSTDGRSAMDELAARGAQWLSVGEHAAMSETIPPPEALETRRRKGL